MEHYGVYRKEKKKNPKQQQFIILLKNNTSLLKKYSYLQDIRQAGALDPLCGSAPFVH